MSLCSIKRDSICMCTEWQSRRNALRVLGRNTKEKMESILCFRDVTQTSVTAAFIRAGGGASECICRERSGSQ